MGGYFVDVCMQYPLLWTHLQRPDICVQILSMFVLNILLRRCTTVTKYVLHILGNISANVANGVCLCICHCPCRQPVDGGNDPAEGSVRADVVVPAGVLEGVATLAECLRRLPCRVVLPVPLQYEVAVVLAEAQLVALVPDGDRELAVLLRVKLYRPATPPV